jgi:hypothetical protein
MFIASTVGVEGLKYSTSRPKVRLMSSPCAVSLSLTMRRPSFGYRTTDIKLNAPELETGFPVSVFRAHKLLSFIVQFNEIFMAQKRVLTEHCQM